LESYHPYLLPQEVSKTPTTLGTYDSLPKIRKGRFGFLRPLGVNLLKNVPSKIHNEKLHQLQNHNVQTSKTSFFKSCLGMKFHLLRIFKKDVFAS
jgi:hypothetical protein